MTHAIDQTISLIAARLKSSTDAAANVFADTDSIIEREALPYIDISYLGDSESDDSVIGWHMREVNIEIRIVARQNGAGRRAVMDIRSQIEAMLPGDAVTLGAYTFMHDMNAVELDTEVQAENDSYELTMDYTFYVGWAIGYPETIIT